MFLKERITLDKEIYGKMENGNCSKVDVNKTKHRRTNMTYLLI